MTIHSNPDKRCYAPQSERGNFIFACKIKLNNYRHSLVDIRLQKPPQLVKTYTPLTENN